MKLTLTQWDRYYPDIGNNRAAAAAKLIQAETARQKPTEIGSYYQQ